MIDYNRAVAIVNKPALAYGLEKYQYIMSHVHIEDVSNSAEFQRVYKAFYGIGRFYTSDFCENYFRILQNMKDTPNISIKIIMEKLTEIQGSYEISFSSKILHTLNPSKPIWDSVVTTKHFDIHRSYAKKDRIDALTRKYELYEQVFSDYMRSAEGTEILHAFDEKFPDSTISDVKKVDFVLWQDR